MFKKNNFTINNSLLILTFWAFTFLFTLGNALQINAQNMEGSGLKNPTKWSTRFDKITGLKIGDIVTLYMETPIENGYHIYSVKVPSKPGPKPTIFVLDKETKDIVSYGGCLDAIVPEKHYDDVFETDVYYFHNRAAFVQQFKITGNNPRIVGALAYQFCTEIQCDDGKKEFDQVFALGDNNSKTDTVKKDTITKIAENLIINDKGGNSTDTGKEPEPDKKDLGSGGLWLLFFKAFAFGLASLITPCVFPMIPMTVTFFLKRSQSRAEGIRNAFIYSTSLISIFVVLGLTLTAIFGAAAITDIATNPYVNVALFGIVFMFGLSFLGMFEITLPSSWTTKLDQKSDQKGVIGIFFMALLLVVASFSCIGPIAGYILVDAASGQMVGPLVGMSGYALGFALPFGMFALFPGWLQSLPKSGGWLNSVKVSLGFLEIAVCMKFLSNADLVMQWHLLNREVFLSIWVAVFGVLGVYLLGKISLPHDTPSEKISAPRSVLAVSSFAFALYLLPGLFGSPLPLLSGILPPPNSNIGVRVHGGGNNTGSEGNVKFTSSNGVCNENRKHSEHLSQYAPDGYCMFYDLDEATAYAKKVNKPLFVDFTGHSCSNCREMEHKVWPEKDVKSMLTNDYVMVSLYLDDQTPLKETIKLPDGKKLRTEGDKWHHYQITEYKISSRPYYVLMDSEKNLLVKEGIGYTPEVDKYVNFLKSGLKNFQEKKK